MIGKKLKELRKERKIKQSDIAKALNLTRPAISQWENDLRDPDIANIKALAKFFNITIDELLENSDYDYDFEYQHNGTKLIHKEKKQ